MKGSINDHSKIALSLIVILSALAGLGITLALAIIHSKELEEKYDAEVLSCLGKGGSLDKCEWIATKNIYRGKR